ncbi:tetratricopeptide repeat protein [Ahrensia sp. R2A130]|uniref:tetratricopeptide repeat protein n=1 Tax=Ahrensia sp. R2A130 TaxID=744979 RepID=UPI0001E0E092|nr:tetratricopeptide repeat protein [Ahrensia sp. R2A130]EFL89840.1 tetratricopeptide TPR_4 containing protein [Ahrensia sp. R2A130]
MSVVSRILVASSLALMLGVTGCASKSMTTGSVPKHLRKPVATMNQTELQQSTDYWQARYEQRPKDKVTGLQFATALRMTNRNEQALAVMQKVAIYHPEDRQVLGAYGKALAGAGQLKKALDTIQRAQTPDNPDWKLHSAEGAIYDQIGDPKQARLQYRKALQLKPGEPSVLSNLGMSYLLEGDLRASETYLKQAIGRPGADSRVRQNLALVIGLQGRFPEAEKVAAGELPPAEAQANVAFLRQMLQEQNAWKELKDDKNA